MILDTNFYRCSTCGNVVTHLNVGTGKVACCGVNMELLTVNSVDASNEKHVPVYEVKGNKIEVSVGAVPHPMLPEHYITWIFVATKDGGHFVNLTPEDKPEAVFNLDIEDVNNIYEYCNLHGLWKAEIVKYETDDETVCSPEFPDGCI